MTNRTFLAAALGVCLLLGAAAPAAAVHFGRTVERPEGLHVWVLSQATSEPVAPPPPPPQSRFSLQSLMNLIPLGRIANQQADRDMTATMILRMPQDELMPSYAAKRFGFHAEPKQTLSFEIPAAAQLSPGNSIFAQALQREREEREEREERQKAETRRYFSLAFLRHLLAPRHRTDSADVDIRGDTCYMTVYFGHSKEDMPKVTVATEGRMVSVSLNKSSSKQSELSTPPQMQVTAPGSFSSYGIAQSSTSSAMKKSFTIPEECGEPNKGSVVTILDNGKLKFELPLATAEKKDKTDTAGKISDAYTDDDDSDDDSEDDESVAATSDALPDSIDRYQIPFLRGKMTPRPVDGKTLELADAGGKRAFISDKELFGRDSDEKKSKATDSSDDSSDDSSSDDSSTSDDSTSDSSDDSDEE